MLEDIIRETLHVDADKIPWVQNRPGMKNRVLHARPEESLIVTQSRADPGAVVALHRHLAPVFAITREGAWGHDPKNFPYRPGTYVYETTNVLHQFYNGPATSEVFFINLGTVEFVDPKTQEVISRETPSSVLERYFRRCEEEGLSRPNILR